MMRQLGIPYSILEQQGIMMPIREMHITYLQPAHYDELLTITACIPKMPTAKMLIEYSIHNEAGVLLNQGSTILVFVDIHSRLPVRPPQTVIKSLRKFFHEG